MSLTRNEINELVTALLVDPAIEPLVSAAKNGTVDAREVQRQVPLLLNDHPSILSLDDNDQRMILGKIRSSICAIIPRPPRVLTPGEEVMALSPADLLEWRRARVRSMATPVAYLFDQVRHGLELEAGHPRRRDLAWDIVNTAVTAIRYITVVAIADYVSEGLSDPHLNRALFDAIRRPADGSWSKLFFSPDAVGPKHSLLQVLSARERPLAALSQLQLKVASADLPLDNVFGVIKGLPDTRPRNLMGLANAFVQFRNQLVHGAYSRKRPDDTVVESLAQLLDVLLSFLRPILELLLVVPREDGFTEAMGPTLGALMDDGLIGDIDLSADLVDLPVLVEGKRALTLSPWVTVADLVAAVHQADEETDDDPEIGLSELCFFNRFESDLLHYLGFAARAQLPHTNLLETDRAEAAFQVFSTTLEKLRAESAPAATRKADPIQRFDQLAASHGENFVGRLDVIEQIKQFVHDRPTPMGVMTAKPGMGKSAILTHFYREHGGVESADGWIFHFSARADQRDNAILGLRSLIAQAQVQLARNQESKKKPPPLPWTYQDLITRFQEVLGSLGNCMANSGRHAVVVIDALDEQAPRPGAPPESIFRGLPDDIPDGVVVVVSVRIDDEGRAVAIDSGRLAAPRGQPLERANPLAGLTPDDVRILVREKLAEEKPELANAPQEVLDRVAAAAQREEDGTLDPFYLRFLADGVREGTVDLTEVGNVPTGLESFFDTLWWGLDTSHDYLLHRMVGMLSEMEGFGSDALFAEALNKPAEEVARLRFGINKLLVQSGAGEDEARYGLFHDRFRWYVQRKFTEADKAQALHTPLLEACRRGVSAADEYAARYTTYHMEALAHHPGLDGETREQVRDEMWQALHDDRFVEKNFEALGDERAIIIDFRRTFEVFRPKPEDSSEEQLVKAGRVTQLADRCARTVAQVANLARTRLHDYAREGDAVRVIQLSERAGSDALRWMTLLRAARTMRDEKLDPNPLFEAIQATRAPALLWTDRSMLARLLTEAEADEEMVNWVLERVPGKPGLVGEATELVGAQAK